MTDPLKGLTPEEIARARAKASVRQKTIRAVEELGGTEYQAREVSRAVMMALVEPDNDMVAAGLAELNLQLGKPKDKIEAANRRNLIRVIWRSMLYNVR